MGEEDVAALRKELNQAGMVPAGVAYTDDQLRQRVAWALAQTFVTNAGPLRATEEWVTFYDIFVRNAFATYRDVLRTPTADPKLEGARLAMRGSDAEEGGTVRDSRAGAGPVVGAHAASACGARGVGRLSCLRWAF